MINVALVIDAIGSYGRGLLRGIARFVHTNSDWAVRYEEWTEQDDLPRWLARGKFQGVLCRVRNSRQFEALRRLGVPIVDLGSLISPPGVANIHSDHLRIAQLAAEHLIHCELSHFAYCGFEGRLFSQLRLAAFQKVLGTRSREPLVFDVSLRSSGLSAKAKRDGQAISYDSKLGAWLNRLPKPVGIMACNDICGRHILAVCQEIGLRVPEQVAVIGVDNDEVLCELAIPALSSVDPGADKIGFDAAELLNDIIRGAPLPVEPLLVAPRDVVMRTSTDIIAAGDETVVAAMRYIRNHATGTTTVEQVLQYLADQSMLVSRSTLERRFKALLGFLPHDEIVRVRIDRIERLLKGTEYPLWRIAEIVGLGDEPHLSRFFKLYKGMAPGEFRRRTGLGLV
jgi:LacI family transcriptional regulator